MKIMYDDLISRQAAIDIVQEGLNKFNSGNGAVRYAINHIKQLPSAEPQIVRCGECKFFNKSPRLWGDERTDGSCKWIVDKLVEQEHFCSWGERRTDED